MLALVLAAIVGFADPVTAVNQPPVTIENWNGEDFTYTTEPLPPRPIDPAGTQLFWIPTAKTLAPHAVRLANNMFIFSQAGVGVTENLQASLSNTLLVASTLRGNRSCRGRFVRRRLAAHSLCDDDR